MRNGHTVTTASTRDKPQRPDQAVHVSHVRQVGTFLRQVSTLRRIFLGKNRRDGSFEITGGKRFAYYVLNMRLCRTGIGVS